MIDSGSNSTYIDKCAANKLNLLIIPKQKTVTLPVSKQKARIIGEVIIDITLHNNTHSCIVVEVIDGLSIDFLVGKDILKRYNKVIFKFDGPQEELVLGAVVNNEHFPAMEVPPPPLFTHLSDNIKPMATKSRRHTESNLKFIREETARMLKEGIIEPSVSPWRAQPIVTTDDNHKRRMCIDFSETINMFTELDAYPSSDLYETVNNISKYNFFSTYDLESAYHQLPIREEDRKYTAFEVDGRLYQFTPLPFGVTNGVSAFQRTINKIIEEENLLQTFAFVDNVTIGGGGGGERRRPQETFKAIRRSC